MHRDKHSPVVFPILTAHLFATAVVTVTQHRVPREERSPAVPGIIQVSGKRWGALRKSSLSKRFRENKELNGFILSHLIALRYEGHPKATWQYWGLSPWPQAQYLIAFLPKQSLNYQKTLHNLLVQLLTSRNARARSTSGWFFSTVPMTGDGGWRGKLHQPPEPLPAAAGLINMYSDIFYGDAD